MKRICFIFFMALASVSFACPVFAFSMNVVDGDVREVLRSVARIENKNIIVDDSVQGSVTVNLVDVNSDDAIKNIALARGLSITRENGTIIVSSKSAISNGFARPHVFPLKYANPEDIQAAVRLMADYQRTADEKTANSTVGEKNSVKKNTGKQANVSNLPSNKSGSSNALSDIRLWTDTGTNSLLLYGTDMQAEEAEKLIEALDVPAKQVGLEAKIVSIEKTAATDLGLDFGWNQVEFMNLSSFDINAIVSALIRKGKAEMLSRPNITTVQGREAVINIGGEVPIPSTSVTNSTTTTSLEYKQTGIILKYTPYVNNDGYITAKVHTEVSNPSFVKEMNAYKFQKRSADTMVRLKNGETMVIGGLIGSEDTEAIAKLPLLGDIPILGNFFRSVHKNKSESEVVIFLTAKLLS